MPGIKRCYRILGLPPGASKQEVKRAYLDLVQVWHPDRFAHNPRLQKKAEDNVKRINEAYETLRDYEPPAAPVPRDWLSESYSAIVDLGDLLKSGTIGGPQPGPRRPGAQARKGPRVVGIDPVERTAEIRVRRRRRRSPWGWALGILAALAVAVVAWLMVSILL